MSEQSKQNVKNGLKNGGSSAVGAGIGVILANAFGEAAQAAPVKTSETEGTESEVEQPTGIVEEGIVEVEQNTPDSSDNKPVDNTATVTPQVTPTVEPTIEPETDVEEEVELRVIDYGEVDNGDGTTSDVAVLEVGSQQIAVVDVDQDGLADMAIVDLNDDGVISMDLDDHEIEDLRGQGISMVSLHQAYEADQLMAEQTIDYENHADVSSWGEV